MEKSEQIQPYSWILGIDVSKESIDACLIRQADGQLFERKFHNNVSGFRHLKTGVNKCNANVIIRHFAVWNTPDYTRVFWFII